MSRPALAWPFLAAASFMLGLGAIVRMAAPEAHGADEIRGVIRLPEPLTAVIVALFGLAALVIFTHLVRRGLRRRRAEAEELPRVPEGSGVPPWVMAIMRIVPLLYLLTLVYLVWHGWIHIPDFLSLGRGAGAAIGPTLEESIPVTAPPLITWAFGLLGLGVGVAALTLALVIAFSDRLEQWWARPGDDEPETPLEQAVDDSVEDLSAELDPRRAIIACYHRFERAAASSRVERKPWNTPLEFMREALGRLPLPRAPLATLTGLFELARFSHHALGASERERALEALGQIKTAIDATGTDAGRE